MRRKGQSTLEYVIILTAVVAAIIYAATNIIKPRMQNILDHVSNEAGAAVNRINF